jgi:hypothetical protein
MEAVVFDDSPLGEYLEGRYIHIWSEHSTHFVAGEGEGGQDSGGESNLETQVSSTSSSPSFAPRGKPTARLKLRHKVPTLRLTGPRNNAVTAIREACSVRSLAFLCFSIVH